MATLGRGIFDVAFFLALSLPSDMLADHEDRFLDMYLAELKQVGGITDYSKEQLRVDYKVALCTSWSIIVYVAGLLSGEYWLKAIKIASNRVNAAVERTGAIGTTMELLQAGVLAPNISESGKMKRN